MRKELQESTQRYDLSSQKGIHPISTVDSKIIETLSSLLAQLDISPNLVRSIRDWKKLPDEDVLNLLQQVGDEIESEGIDVSKRVVEFIEIGNFTLLVKSLFSIKKEDGYDVVEKQPIFKIIINESENLNFTNCNKEIKFTDWADRDICLEDLKEKLSQFTTIKFL